MWPLEWWKTQKLSRIDQHSSTADFCNYCSCRLIYSCSSYPRRKVQLHLIASKKTRRNTNWKVWITSKRNCFRKIILLWLFIHSWTVLYVTTKLNSPSSISGSVRDHLYTMKKWNKNVNIDNWNSPYKMWVKALLQTPDDLQWLN